ncbi:MAG: hypothetical protein M1833_005589 [Piccolia ochrophora]|nr:MAG: hypothetical protein M1833_005589 [Piccolia ochrophora]
MGNSRATSRGTQLLGHRPALQRLTPVSEMVEEGTRGGLIDAVRAGSQWYDKDHPPIPPPTGTAETLIHRIKGDSGGIYEYTRPSERPDGGLELLKALDLHAQNTRDPAFSPLNLVGRGLKYKSVKHLVEDDGDGYSYWMVEDFHFDMAWAGAMEGWWILGIGVGKDKGNIFMEEKESRSLDQS